MPNYKKAGRDVTDTIERMLKKYHQPLVLAGVTIDALMALPVLDDEGEPKGPALKLHGYECGAVVKVNSTKLRVQGHADAEIIVSDDHWDRLTDAERDALIDHELEHLELKTDADDNIVSDDLGRPKLKLRLHDHQFGWFYAVVRRHGVAAIESQQALKFVEHYEQTWLPYMTAEEEEETEVLAKVG